MIDADNSSRNFRPRRLFRGLLNSLSGVPVFSELIYGARDLLLPKTHGTWFVCNVASWKQPFLETYLKDLGARRVEFVSREADKYVLRNQFCTHRDEQIIIWGAVEPPALMDHIQRRKLKIWRLEDGFIRSIGLGARHIPPASLMLDRTGGIYFRSDRPSALEAYLASHEFTDTEIDAASKALDAIRSANLTKYNLAEDETDFGIRPEDRNILVFGQCEDDQSVIHGSPKIKLNSELLEQVLQDYPGCRIFFRPHPDVVAGLRPQLSDISVYADRVTIMDGPFPVWKKINLFEKVCVLTSLAGFEALIRGVAVQTYGIPFYAGWGLTDDHVTTKRRNRKLSLEEVFYGAYLAQPHYIEPQTGHLSNFEAIVGHLKAAQAD